VAHCISWWAAGEIGNEAAVAIAEVKAGDDLVENMGKNSG